MAVNSIGRVCVIAYAVRRRLYKAIWPSALASVLLSLAVLRVPP